MIERSHLPIISERLEKESRKFIQVIYGPRQVGKTTAITQFTQQTNCPYHFTSADNVSFISQSWISQQWEIARLQLKPYPQKTGILIIDEIQKIDNWSEQVKAEWDADTRDGINLKVVLLGSSRLLLQKGLTESLAGRFETLYMGHWTYSEMNQAFGLTEDQFVWFGGYPGAASLIHDESRWKNYVADSLIETSISKDILMMTQINKPILLRRLFELGCEYSGQILSFNKIMGQLHDAGNTTTLAHYLNLLDTAGLLKGIEKYGSNTLRKRASSPKFQVHNTALISAQQPFELNEIRSRPNQWGRWVESAIGTHLLNCSLTEPVQLYYWRHRNDEVDFILIHKDKVIGIEVKSGKGKVTRGMNAFQKSFNPHRVWLIGEGGLPWQTFLGMNPLELF